MPRLGTSRKGYNALPVLYRFAESGRKKLDMPTKTNLRQLRKERGLSQTDVALSIHTTLNMYGKLERGERRLNMDWLRKLAMTFEVGMDQIVASVEPDRVEEGAASPTLDALSAMVAEHYRAVMGSSASPELVEDLAQRIFYSVENWSGDPDAARDPRVARSVARQINLRFDHPEQK